MSRTDDTSSGDDRMSAEEWGLSDKHPELLPTPWLDPYEFEAFTRRLLRAQRFLGPEIRRVIRVAQYGVPGDKQDGIDLRGDFSDGAHAAWQCRHLERLRASDVRSAVAEVTYQGTDECYLVFAGIATRQAQEEMDKHAGWQLWTGAN